jgi:beta-lactamase class A
MIKFLTGCLITLIASFILVFYVFKPNFNFNHRGVALQTKSITGTFFIPADKPIFVYHFDPFPAEIEAIVKQNISQTDGHFGIYLKNLTTNQLYLLNADEQFNSASLYKLFVMYTIFKKGKEGQLDSNSSEVQSNLALMIEASSNEAADSLVNNYTSWREVDADAKSLGYVGTNFLTDELTTPKDVGRLLELIANGQAVSEDASKQMITFMAQQQRRDRIPALLPNNIFIVNKTGELNDVNHDAAIIGTPTNDYILVIMSKGSASPDELKPAMAKMSLQIYQFFEDEWKNPPEIL